MIKLENLITPSPEQWKALILGARNAMNSWEKSDSKTVNMTLKQHEITPGVTSLDYEPCEPYIDIGPNDHDLMTRLRNAGTDHRKFMRMIIVYVDILAPLYWWKEFDTYRVGVEKNSCSTMHKIHEKEFTLDDFSCEHLYAADDIYGMYYSTTAEEEFTSSDVLKVVIEALNVYRDLYLKTKDKTYWWQMIQLLPSSYNQKRTVMLNYEVLANMYKSRKDHKLDEWREFCEWIETLPYSELITGEKDESENP